MQVRWAALALGVFLVGFLAQRSGAPAPVYWAYFLSSYVAGGWQPAVSAFDSLRARRLDPDLLVVVGAIGALAVGQVAGGALLLALAAVARAIVGLVVDRTETVVRELIERTPDYAIVRSPDGAQRWCAVPDLAAGDTILVRPGERVAAPGKVVGGAGDVTEPSAAGAVRKRIGDEVLAGSVNGTGALIIRIHEAPPPVDDDRTDEVLAQTLDGVPPLQQRIARWAAWSVLGIAALTLALFVVVLVLRGDIRFAGERTVTFLVAASPCAVVSAVMPPLLAAMGRTGQQGALIKSVSVMPDLWAIDTVAFDKTGTVTEGRPFVALVCALGRKVSDDDVLLAAAAVELMSEHPLASAIVDEARRQGLHAPTVTGFVATPGSGVSGDVDGRRIAVMSPRDTSTRLPAGGPDMLAKLERAGHTVVLVTRDSAAIGLIALSDRPRDEAARVMKLLGDNGIRTVLMTGDNVKAAHRVADELGMSDVRAGLLPDSQTGVISRLREGGRRVAVVADGVSDVPALEAANVGIAIGTMGADLALRASDVVIGRGGLRSLPTALLLARRARKIVRANMSIGIAVAAALGVWALIGGLPLAVAALVQGVSMIVVAAGAAIGFTEKADPAERPVPELAVSTT